MNTACSRSSNREGNSINITQIFNRYLEVGGEEKSVARIAEHLELQENLDRFWVESSEWVGREAPSLPRQVQKMFRNQDVAQRLRDRVGAFKTELLLCHNIYPIISPVVYEVARSEGLPLIQYIHNFRPFSVSGSLWTGSKVAAESLQGNYLAEVVSGSWQGSRAKSLVMAGVLTNLHRKKLTENVSMWIAISEFMRSKFIEAGVPASRVVTLRHSWNAQSDPPKYRDEGYYLFLGRLVKEKGIRCLLDAWRQLEKEMGKNTPPLIIAGSGSEESLVREAVEKSQCIQFRNFVEGSEKEELIAGCRAMLAPSIWWEPLGLVTYEAYDYNKPVIAASSGGLTETIQDRTTGFLHASDDSQELMKKVLLMEELSSEERYGMGQAGRAWLLDKASPERWRSDFDSILAPFRK